MPRIPVDFFSLPGEDGQREQIDFCRLWNVLAFFSHCKVCAELTCAVGCPRCPAIVRELVELMQAFEKLAGVAAEVEYVTVSAA